MQANTVRYHKRGEKLLPEYICQRQSTEDCGPKCQGVMGASIDEAIGTLLIETVTPMALDVALSVQTELESRAEQVDQLRRKQIDRAKYDADLAKRRYMKVDPDNRLVADSLEAEWNQKLQALTEAQQECERQRQADKLALADEQQRAQILALSTNFPKLWSDPKTSHRDRKRILALLIEDVTLRKDDDTITAHVRFKGGATKSLVLPRPQPAWHLRKTCPEVIREITRLAKNYTDTQIAKRLNNLGLKSGTGRAFTQKLVTQLRLKYTTKAS